jgi:hypothetical protein
MVARPEVTAAKGAKEAEALVATRTAISSLMEEA